MENLHTYMQQLSVENKKYADAEKVEYLRQISMFMQNTYLQNQDENNSTSARLLKYECISEVENNNENILNSNNRFKYLVCTVDELNNDEYMFCTLCAFFSGTKSSLTRGCVIVNYSKANAIICSHEKSVQHKKAFGILQRLDGISNTNDLSASPSTRISEFRSCIPATITTTTTTVTTTSATTWIGIRSIPITTTVSTCELDTTGHGKSVQYENAFESQPSAGNPAVLPHDMRTKLELEPVDRNRKIVYDVICCVLMIVSLGNYFTLFFRFFMFM